MTGEDPRSVSERMAISEDPANYEPREGDVLEWCDHIRIEVGHVTPDGHVSIQDIPPNTTSDARLYVHGERPDPDPNRHPPLGITTWAGEDGTVSVEDLQRLLRHGWELSGTR